MTSSPTSADTLVTETGAWAYVPQWILRYKLNGSEMRTYVALRTYANQQGVAWPKVKTLAERAYVDVSTAEKAISKLRNLGLLTTTVRRRDDGTVYACTYMLRDTDPGLVGGQTRETEGQVTRETEGHSPAKRREQEHTREHTSGNTPSSWGERSPQSPPPSATGTRRRGERVPRPRTPSQAKQKNAATTAEITETFLAAVNDDTYAEHGTSTLDNVVSSALRDGIDPDVLTTGLARIAAEQKHWDGTTRRHITRAYEKASR